MIEYCIVFLLSLIFVKLIKRKKIEVKDAFMIIVLVLFAGLRNGIGTDYNMYKAFYFNPSLQSAEKVEEGFITLINVSNMIFNDKYYLFFIVCSIISIVPVYSLFKKNSRYPGLSLLLFISLGFYTLTFNMVRQFIAMAIVFCSISFIQKKQFFRYLACIIIAALFHTTALIMIPIYFWSNFNFTKKQIRQIFLILLFAGVVFNPIFNFVTSHIPQYSMYANYGGVTPGIGTYLINFIYIFIILFVIFNYEKMIKNETEKICLNFGILSVAFIILSLKNILFARLIYYFFIPLLIPFANIFDFFNYQKSQKVFNVILVVLLFIIYILNIISFNGVYPYVSIWSV